ncbi:MAG: T9SS C-terminal target domain-containing protein [Ignavibacteriae bacterium]|nr:MAG: T9SS C-terminal target domain-containing protein [Ignavibacteriota bacterium]
MNKYISLILFTLIVLFFAGVLPGSNVVIQQVQLDGNNINASFINTGIFDQDLRTSNTPGFEWPKGSGKYAVFTAGLSCGAYIQNNLREFMCSYKGELAPGYIIDSAGTPKPKTDSRFKLYKVRRNFINDPDWLNWQLMTPFGAPFIDVNNNNIYEPFIDTPGVKGASQTIFACFTDGFPETHTMGEGFGGGTVPMFAEIRLTAWCYGIPGLEDIQYIKWQVINKNKFSWDSTFFAIVTDPDLGNASDDYIGCDTIRRLGFCYNGDNNDDGSYSYGINPPAVGFKLIRSAKKNDGTQLGMTSFVYFSGSAATTPPCELDPNGEAINAYYFLTGVKKDKTPWVIPPGGSPSLKTKFVYSGDPETGLGWNEGLPGNPSGSVKNCGGPDSLSGTVIPVNGAADRKMIISSGSKQLKINPGDTQIIVAAQLIARGNSNLNSVTKLKQLSDVAQYYYDSVNAIGIENISNEIPQQYKLYQNYPNPFNPKTIINYQLPMSNYVQLLIYDVMGKKAAVLVNQKQNAGTYEAEWDASQFASGIYFYSLMIDGNLFDSKKMVLIK